MLSDLPSWIDAGLLKTWAGILSIVALVGALGVLFLMRSVLTRVVLVLLLAAAVGGLLRYRSTLDHCDTQGCTCKFLGEEIKGGACNARG